jgi:hypothetical protein
VPGEIHTHEFKGVTVFIDGHLHLFSGVSGPAPNVPGHTHAIGGVTSVNGGHSHAFSMQTIGPTYVDRMQYKHYHYFKGTTDTALFHSHPMSATTFVLGE